MSDSTPTLERALRDRLLGAEKGSRDNGLYAYANLFRDARAALDASGNDDRNALASKLLAAREAFDGLSRAIHKQRELPPYYNQFLRLGAVIPLAEDLPSDASGNDELVETLTNLRRWAVVLHQNSVGCAINHYGADFEAEGMPGWLVDAQAAIKQADAAIARTQEQSDG